MYFKIVTTLPFKIQINLTPPPLYAMCKKTSDLEKWAVHTCQNILQH